MSSGFLGVNFSGFTSLMHNLDAAIAVEQMSEVMKFLAERSQEYAEEFALKFMRTGDFRDSISTQILSSTSGRLENPIRYARYAEFNIAKRTAPRAPHGRALYPAVGKAKRDLVGDDGLGSAAKAMLGRWTGGK
jgi:hypothetical protein